MNAISAAGDARTKHSLQDPGSGGILYKNLSMDSTYLYPWDSMNSWHCGMNFCHLASLHSEQLEWRSILGRSKVIRLWFGNILEHAEGYSTLFFWANWARAPWRKSQWNIFDMGRFWDTISVSGDVRTCRMDPRSGEIL